MAKPLHGHDAAAVPTAPAAKPDNHVPKIITRVPTAVTPAVIPWLHEVESPAPTAGGSLGNLDIPSRARSQSPLSEFPAEQPPAGISPVSINGHSRPSSVHLEEHGITVYTETDRGYTAAEKMQKNASQPSGTATHDKGLAELIYNSCELDRDAPANRRRWLPIDQLFTLINRESVRGELARVLPSPKYSKTDLDHFTDAVCSEIEYEGPAHKDTATKGGRKLKTSRRCIFVALVIKRKVGWLPDFAASDIWDKDLPLRRDGRGLVSCADNSETRRTVHLDDWDNWAIEDFCSNDQFYALSPFFDLGSQNDVPFHDLSHEHRLPWVVSCKDHPERPRVGLHGTVWKVQIHPAHHNFYTEGDTNPYFAVKKLTSDDGAGDNFITEVSAWAKSVGVAGHNHIIRLLATWRQNNSWYLLFGWANGNLHDFWKANGPVNQPNLDQDDRHKQTQWVGEQCLGIAQALAKIHRANSNPTNQGTDIDFGIHGDIKPENIVRFEDKNTKHGRLVICDFGFTKFHSRLSRSAANPAGLSPTYRAPEYDANERTQGGISRAYDTWALGCVYLEFMTWHLKGFEAVDDTFSDNRVVEDRGYPVPCDQFFMCVTVDQANCFGAIVKPCVHEWICSLRRLDHCSKFCHDFLDIIEHHLLVVDPKGRSDCHTLAKKLADIYTKSCDSDNGPEYTLVGEPKKSTPPNSPHGTMPSVFAYPKAAAERLRKLNRDVAHLDTRKGKLVHSQDSNLPQPQPQHPQPPRPPRPPRPRAHFGTANFSIASPSLGRPSTVSGESSTQGAATPRGSVTDIPETSPPLTEHTPLLQYRDVPEQTIPDQHTLQNAAPRGAAVEAAGSPAAASNAPREHSIPSEHGQSQERSRKTENNLMGWLSNWCSCLLRPRRDDQDA